MRALDRVATVLLTVPPALLLLSFFLFARDASVGVDITDEGMYLNTITSSDIASVASSAWYFFAKALWNISGQSIAAVRVAGFGLLVVGAASLAEGALAAVRTKLEGLERAAFTAAVALGAVLYFTWLPRTVSYNLLNAASVLLATGFALRGLAQRSAPSMAVAAAIVSVAFFVKWPTGVILIAGLLVLTLVWPELSWPDRGRCAGAIVAGLGLGFAAYFLLCEGWGDFRARAARTAAAHVLIDAGHSAPAKLLAGYAGQLGDLLQSSLRAGFAGAVVAAVGARRPGRGPSWGLLAGWLITAAFVVHGGEHVMRRASVHTLVVPYCGFALVLLAHALATPRRRSTERRDLRPTWTVLTLTLLPFAYAVGTNARIDAAITAGLAPAITAMALVVTRRREAPTVARSVPLALISIVAVSQLVTARAEPYRSAALSEQTEATAFPGGPLDLDPPTHAFFVTMKAAADACGLASGQDLVDLTGGSPGVVYALRGRSPLVAWWIGGYPGSARYLQSLLERLPPERRSQAWLLMAPRGARKVDGPAILRAAGLDPGAYRRCGQARWPVRDEIIELWRPRRGPATAK